MISFKFQKKKKKNPGNLEFYAEGKTKSEKRSDEQQLKESLNSKCSTGNAILHDLGAEGRQKELRATQRNEKCATIVTGR